MVYVLLAEGFEEIEALTPVDLLRRAGVETELVSVSGNADVCGAHGIVVKTAARISEVVEKPADAVILPGGMPGAEHLEQSREVRQMLEAASARGSLLCAICAAPKVLGRFGFLKGKKAVCYPGFEEQLTGAELTDLPVVRDGSVITSKGMGTAVDFGLEIVKALCGAETAAQLSRGIQYR